MASFVGVVHAVAIGVKQRGIGMKDYVGGRQFPLIGINQRITIKVIGPGLIGNVAEPHGFKPVMQAIAIAVAPIKNAWIRSLDIVLAAIGMWPTNP
jgi:hypothetical protein